MNPQHPCPSCNSVMDNVCVKGYHQIDHYYCYTCHQVVEKEELE